MSYCVNCGVELAESERVCPLCRTEVVNPAAPWKEPTMRPYPKQVEVLMHHLDRQFAAGLLGIILCIPIFVTLLCDLLPDGRITWSAYVLGAMVMAMVWILLPLGAKRYHQIRFLSFDGLSAAVYLWAICHVAGGKWFWPLAFPITALATVFALLLVFLSRRSWGRDWLTRVALGFLSAGVFTMAVELMVDLYLTGTLQYQWAPYVLIPCVVLAAVARMIAKRQKLRDEIAKRLFY